MPTLVKVDYDPFADEEPVEAIPVNEPPESDVEVLPERPISDQPSAALPPQGEPSAPPVTSPGPVAPAAEPPAKPLKLRKVQFDPFNLPQDQPGFSGSVAAGYTGGIDAMTGVVDMARIMQLPEDQQVAAIIAASKQEPPADQPEMMDISQVEGFGDAWEFTKQALGQTLGSMAAAATVGGGAGAAVGAGVGGVGGATVGGVGAVPGAAAGAVTGFGYGTTAAFVGMGVGGTFKDLIRDEGVQKALQDGTLTPTQLYAWSGGAGAAVGALDAIPGERVIKQITGGLTKEAAKKTLKTVLLSTAKTSAIEGSTEAAQQAISEFSQAVAGGDYKTAERLWNVINAGATGVVGGAGPGAVGAVTERNVDTNLPPKQDDVPDKTTETLPEGTPAAATPDVGQPSPGGKGEPPPQPAGAGQQPPSPGPAVVVAGSDPATVAKPPLPASAVPGKSSVVSTSSPGGAPADVAAALAPEPEEYEAFDLESEVGIDDLSRAQTQHETAIAALLDRRKAEAPAVSAPAVVPAGTDEKAAIDAIAAAAPKPVPQVGAQPQPTISPAPQIAGAAAPAAAPQPAVPAENIPAAAPAPVAEVEPAATMEEPTSPLEVGVAGQPTPPTQELPGEAAAAEPTLNPPARAAPLRLVPVAVPPVFEETAAAPATAVEPVTAPLAQKAKIVSAQRAVEPLPAAGGPVVQTKAKRALVGLPGAKGGLLKRAEVEAERRQVEEAVQRGHEAEAARPRLSRDAERRAHELVLESQSTVSDIPGYRTELRRILDEEAAKAEKGMRPVEAIEDTAKRAAARARTELAEKAEAADIARIKAEEEKTVSGKRAAKKTAKQEEMATATTGQKKERAGKLKGKSGVGILAESEKATYAQAKKKPEDKLLQAWRALHERKPKDEGEKAEIAAKKRQVQELRAEQAETFQLKERADAVKKTVDKVLEAHPLPDIGAIPKAENQIAAAKKHLTDFVAALNKELKADKQTLAGRPDRKHNSMVENLAIYAKKVAGRKEIGHGAYEFWMAHEAAIANDKTNFYGITSSEQMQGVGTGGVEYKEDERGGLETRESVREREEEAGPRRHQQASEFYEIDLRRTGRDATRAREQAMAERAEQQGQRGKHRHTVTTQRGEFDVFPSERRSAKTVIAEIRQMTNERKGGFQSILRNVLLRHLEIMIGDVPVYTLSAGGMKRITGTAYGAEGAYFNYPHEMRAAGYKPEVYINEETLLDPDEYIHTVVHELVHAASSQAITDGVRGIDKIIDKMRTELWEELGDNARVAFKYAFKNNQEFIAEAFANRQFQEVLSTTPVSARVAREIGAITPGRRPTWWDAFTAAISHAIGMISGRYGHSYMEQVIKLWPDISRGSAAQQMISTREVQRRAAERQRERDEFEKIMNWQPDKMVAPAKNHIVNGDVDFLVKEANNQLQGLSNEAGGWFTAKRYMFATTGELGRIADSVFGEDSAFHKLSGLLLKRDPLRQKYRAQGQQLELDVMNMKRYKPAKYQEMQRWLYDATLNGSDPRHDLKHASNKHIHRGNMHRRRRNQHAKLEAQWAAMDSEQQALANRSADHYAESHEQQTRTLTHYAVGQALKAYRKPLPAGKTIDDVVAWARSGRYLIDPADQTAEDKFMHEALGKSAETIGAVRDLRALKGLYVPLTRQGKYFISATEKVLDPNNLPAGAVMGGENRLLFDKEQELQDFIDGYEGDVRMTTQWVDATTGLKSHHKEINAVKIYVAILQNKRMETADTQAELETRRKELKAAGHSVSEVSLLESAMEFGSSEITSTQMNRLIKNIEQTTDGQMTIGKKAAVNAARDAHVRMMTKPSIMQRHLKRKGVAGYDVDMAGAMRQYNQQAASHRANLELAPQFAEADSQLRKDIEAKRKGNYQKGKGSAIQMQLMRQELHKRLESSGSTKETTVGRASNVLMNMTFLNKLFSPHYTVMQLLQPAMTTVPVLSSKYGHGAAWREMIKAYRMGGIRRTLGKGFTETWANTVNLNPRAVTRVTQAEMRGLGVQDAVWQEMIKGQPDEAQLRDVFDGVVEMGFGSASGIEVAALSEQDLTKGEKAIARVSAVAKAMPEAAEGIARYTTATATYRLARRAGRTHEQAKAEAVSTVEQTQGGYSAANNPAFMQNPMLRWPLQFRKYGLMYGQMYYKALFQTLSLRTDKETRKVAAKQLAGLSVMTMAFAGAFGLPMMEMARILANVAFGLGLDDDDWEDWEVGIQEAFNALLGGTWSEAGLRGLTRLIDVDTSTAMGADNLATFGSPKSIDEEGVKVWLFNALLGAPGGVATDMLKAISDGDIQGIIPWPKFVENMRKAYGEMTQGTVSKKTGEKFAPPTGIGEAITRGLGFTPASVARQFEAGGGGVKAREKKDVSFARRKIFDRWNSAAPAEQRRIFREDIREWNRTHKDKRDRIDYGDLRRSVKERERRRKEREED